MPRKRIKLINEEKVTETDRLTGEVVERVTRKRYSIPIRQQDEFFMTFIRFMGPYYEIKYADDFKILAKLCSMAHMNTGVVELPAQKRKKVMEELSMTQAQVSRSLKRLSDLGLISGSGGMYEVSHEIFWRGGTDERAAKAERVRIDKSVVVEFRHERDVENFENQ